MARTRDGDVGQIRKLLQIQAAVIVRIEFPKNVTDSIFSATYPHGEEQFCQFALTPLPFQWNDAIPRGIRHNYPQKKHQQVWNYLKQ